MDNISFLCLETWMLARGMQDCETTRANHGVVVPIEAAVNSASLGRAPADFLKIYFCSQFLLTLDTRRRYSGRKPTVWLNLLLSVGVVVYLTYISDCLGLAPF